MAIFGNTSIGGWDSDLAANVKFASKHNLDAAASGEIGIYIYARTASPTLKIKGHIWSADVDEPDALLHSTQEKTGVVAGWNNLKFSGISLPAGDYFIGFLADEILYTRLNTPGAPTAYNSDSYATGPTDPFGTHTDYAYDLSIYVNYNNLVEQLTSNTAPSPNSASASSEYSSTYAAWKAFDGSNSSFWVTTVAGVTPCSLAYSFGSGNDKLVNSYAITSRPEGGGSSPTAWTFEGYDGSSWNVLDTRTGVTDWSAGETKTFTFSNTELYEAYRISISASNGSTVTGLAQLMLFNVTPIPSTGFNLYLGSTQIQEIYHGSTEIVEAYLGTAKLS